jgi:hypothetical protein
MNNMYFCRTKKLLIMKRIITFAFLAAMTFSISCSQTSQANNKVDIDAQGPLIKFEVIEHDFGTIENGADGTYNFTFVNNGTEPLILNNVQSSCGCTIPKWPREPIAPGTSAAIDVRYDTKRIGAFNKSITVTSNGSENPIVLKIKGNVLAPPTTAGANQ